MATQENLDENVRVNISQTTEIRSSRTLKEKARSHLAKVAQFLTWPFLFIFFHTFFRLKMLGVKNLKTVSTPFIIIANHVGWYDSFLFRLTLGIFTPHLPLRFIGVKKFDWPFLNFMRMIGVVEIVYAILGVVTIIQGENRGGGVEKIRSVLEGGDSVVIYPEGGINRSDTIEEFRTGAAVLAIQTSVPVVPVAFHLRRIRGFVRPVLSMNIGLPIEVGTQSDPRKLTGSLRETTQRLFKELS